MTYHIKLQQFEGPLDLLLHLIEKAKVDIKDIFISEVTEQYLEYLHQMQKLDMEIASEFLVIAATLIQIKSNSLLPKPKKVQQQEEDENPEEELIRRLVEYKKYKEICEELKSKEEYLSSVYYKLPEEYPVAKQPVMLIGLELKDLYRAFEKVLERQKNSSKHAEIRAISREQFTVQEKMFQIQSILRQKPFIHFHDLFHQEASKIEIIVSFIALLELIKLNRVCIRQQSLFGEIQISRSGL